MSTSNLAQSLEHKVPPLALLLLLGGLAWLAARKIPALGFILPGRMIVVLVLVVLGTALILLGVTTFRKARTTLNPLKPEQASSMVTSGIYQYTRNPMYLGMLLALAGWTTFLSNFLSYAALPAFVIYMNRFQISPEERVLASLFTKDFTAYQSKVRRWL